MTPARLFRFALLRLLPLLLLGLATHARAQADPPGRVGRLNHAEGAVTYAPAGDNEWVEAEANRPLVRGDRLWTDKGTRADLQFGSAAVRMDGQTQVQVLAVDDQSVQLSLTQGSVYVRVRSLPEGENFEIDTPNLAWRASYPGDYRIDVNPQAGTTRVTIHSGTGAVYGEKGQSLTMGGGQQITFRARTLAQANVQEQPPQDNFDRWAAERNRREDQSVAARYLPREIVGYQQLDAAGQWAQDASLGAVWTPQATPANWAPYRNGRWEWIAPWGWTWIDDAPWGFVTSHYGRWALVNAKWAWVPGRMGLRPMYAPALVAFVGNGAGGMPVGGKQGVAWFPLAPGEAWQPGYRATPLYISTVNANMPPQPPASFAHQRRPEALTAISTDDFHRGKPVKASWVRVAANLVTQAQVVPPPAMPERARTAVARAAPASADLRPVAAAPAAPQPAQLQAQAQAAQERLQREAQEKAQREQAARAAEQQRIAAEQQKLAQARVAEQQRVAAEQQRAAMEQQRAAAEQQRVAQVRAAAEQQRAAEQARLAREAKAAQQVREARAAEQARREQLAQAKAAEQHRTEQARREAMQAKRDAQAKRTQDTKRELAARREQAKREQVAQAQARREAAAAKAVKQRELQAAKRAEQAQRVAAAKRDEQARHAAHAQQVESARRAADRDAQALREQRQRREEQQRREAAEREQQQREAWSRQQQALAEQWRRDQQAWEAQQQREREQRARQAQRPDLRRPEPEVWQRGIPILNPGRTS